LPFAAVHSALPANATLAKRNKANASVDGKLHAWTDVMAEVLRPTNIVFGFFMNYLF
jgi:hypothetical protein